MDRLEPAGQALCGETGEVRLKSRASQLMGSSEAVLESFLFISEAKGIPLEVLKCGE